MDEFNKKSIHVMLPDNFGFSYALPTIASHMGMRAFRGCGPPVAFRDRPAPFADGEARTAAT